MLSRALKINVAITRELERHSKALEVDEGISKINFTVIIGARNGDPVKVIYAPVSELDLTR